MPLIGAVTSSGLSWTGWINFGDQGSSVYQSVTALGLRHTDQTFFEIQKTHGAGEYKFQVYLRLQQLAGGWRTAGGAGDHNLWEFTSTDDWSSGWNHFAVVWHAADTSNGALASVSDKVMKIYYNGVDTLAERIDSNTTKNYYSTWDATKSGAFGFTATVANMQPINVTYNGAFSIGGDFTGIRPMSGAIDEYTYWTRVLNSSEVSAIYNGGVPCDVTKSAAFLADPPSLWDWIRFGTGSTNEKTDIFTYNNGQYDNANRVVGFAGNKTYLPLAVSGGNNPAFELTGTHGGHLSVLAGCPAAITESTTTTTCTGDYIYDNFFITHPIPRSSKQYTWITRSLMSDNGNLGFVSADFLMSASTGGVKNSYTFVSQSDFGRYYQTTSPIDERSKFGWTSGSVAAGSNTEQFIPVDFVGLNTIVIDPVNTDINTIGNTTNADVTSYINYDIIDEVANNESSASILNALTLHRQGVYGFPTWRQSRHSDNPIIRWERQNNRISMISVTGTATAMPATTTTPGGPLVTPGVSIARYGLPPISMEGRPVSLNVTLADSATNVTLDATNNNESIYFSAEGMNDQFNINYNAYTTPYEQLVEAIHMPTSEMSLNWAVYTQKLFPASRNEFMSYSNERVNYDNRYPPRSFKL